jgi:hypothetical protein
VRDQLIQLGRGRNKALILILRLGVISVAIKKTSLAINLAILYIIRKHPFTGEGVELDPSF